MTAASSRHRGFTLVEVLVVLALIAIIVSTVELSIRLPDVEVAPSIGAQQERVRRLAIEAGRPVRRVLTNGDTVVTVTALPDGRLLSMTLGTKVAYVMGSTK